jgi:hypothetical protein
MTIPMQQYLVMIRTTPNGLPKYFNEDLLNDV